MTVAVFGANFLDEGRRSTTVEFSHSGSGRTAATVQAALRARQVGPGTITVTATANSRIFDVDVTVPDDAPRPAFGSTDLWEFDDGTRTYRSGDLVWRWDADPAGAPEVFVDVAFGHGASVQPSGGYNPGWGSALASDLGEEITGYRISRLNPVRAGKITRGRPHELASGQAGRAVLTLDDSNGFLDPDNPNAPAPYRDSDGNATLVPGRPIRVLVRPQNRTSILIVFLGLIERVGQRYPGQTDELVDLECVDFRKLLASGSMSENRPDSTDLTNAYEVLCAYGGRPQEVSSTSPYPVERATVVQVGDTVPIDPYSLTAGLATASSIRDLERATGSLMRINRSGGVDILLPSTYLTTPSTVVDVSDGTGPATPLRYSSVEFARDDDRIINRVLVGDTNLISDITATVAASQRAFGVRTHRVAESPLSSADQFTWAAGLIRRWSQPTTRLKSLQLKPRQVPDLWEDTLNVEVGDAWRVTRTSPVGELRRVTTLIERIQHTFTRNDWTTDLAGTQINPLDSIVTFTLTDGGTHHSVVDGAAVYEHRVFASSATVTAVGSAEVQILCIGGGGGGGGGPTGLAHQTRCGAGGGGGAGGITYSGAVALASGDSLAVTVGAGGAAGSAGTTEGSSRGTRGGESSVVHDGVTYRARGGGGGGRAASSSSSSGGQSGASGGGGGARRTSSEGSGGSSFSAEGHDGGDGDTGSSSSWSHFAGGGGGGGRGGAGGDAVSTSLAGAQGAGQMLNLIGTAATYAVGGGGGRARVLNATVAGIVDQGARAATAGGGGGGGGGASHTSSDADTEAATDGRDGLVVIRWRRDIAPLTAGGSPAMRLEWRFGATAFTFMHQSDGFTGPTGDTSGIVIHDPTMVSQILAYLGVWVAGDGTNVTDILIDNTSVVGGIFDSDLIGTAIARTIDGTAGVYWRTTNQVTKTDYIGDTLRVTISDPLLK